MNHRLPPALVVLAACLVAAGSAAQQRGGDVAGVVRESGGSPLSGVGVTLSGETLLVSRSTSTTRAGRFWFADVPPGQYRLRAETSGVQWADREVVVVVGSRVELVLVPGERRAGIVRVPSGAAPGSAAPGATFTRIELDRLPTGRDPWAFIDLTPGVLAAEVLPGGALGRTQPRWASRGSTADSLWSVDSATWTDLLAGESMLYYDFDTIDQLRVQTAGHDASIQAAGTNVSIVTRGGGNRFRGSARWNWSGSALESGNLTGVQRQSRIDAGDPLVSAHEAGAEAGGPIRRSRAWFFVALSITRAEHGLFGLSMDPNADAYDVGNLHRQVTGLANTQVRVDLRAGSSQTLTLVALAARRTQNPFSAAPTAAPESWYRLHGMAPAARMSHDAVFGRLLLDSQVSFADGGRVWDFQTPDQTDIQPAMDMPTLGLSRSNRRVDFIRRTVEVKADGALLVGRGRRTDHAVKFGLRLRRDQDGERSHVGGFATANFWKRLPNGATLYRDGDQHHSQSTLSAYASDTLRLGRATLVAGLRLDRQTDRADTSSAPANPIAPEWLPAFDFTGASAGVAFVDLAPRATFTWDLAGTGRTVAKIHAGRYFGAGLDVSRRLDPSGLASVTLPWTDDDHDGFVQRDELHPGDHPPPPLPAPPVPTGFTVDPDLANDRVTEVLAGLEQEISHGLSVGVTAIWRQADRRQTVLRDGVTSADYVPITRTVNRCEAGRCAATQTITYYDLTFEPTGGQVVTNLDAHTTHRALEFVVRGRPSAGTKFDAALTLSDTRLFYNGAGSYQDPTRVPFEDRAQYGTMNARWEFKSSGLFALPWELATSFVVNGRQGYPLVKSLLVSYRRYAGSVVVPLEPIGTSRLDTVWTADWRVERAFRFGRSRLVAGLDLFNVANVATPTRRQALQDRPDAGDVLAVVPPRTARIGARFEF